MYPGQHGDVLHLGQRGEVALVCLEPRALGETPHRVTNPATVECGVAVLRLCVQRASGHGLGLEAALAYEVFARQPLGE